MEAIYKPSTKKIQFFIRKFTKPVSKTLRLAIQNHDSTTMSLQLLRDSISDYIEKRSFVLLCYACVL